MEHQLLLSGKHYEAYHFSDEVVSYNASTRKVTAKDFIQDNLLTVSLIAGISFFVVLCIILDSLKKSKRAEEKSRSLLSRH